MSKMNEEICLARPEILMALREAESGPAAQNLLLAGPWGAGKTTLLRQLCKELKDSSDCHILWFSPWDTVADGDARMAFLRLLRDELKPVADKCAGNDGRRAKKLLDMLENLLSSKPGKTGLTVALGGVLGGNEAFILGSFVRLGRILMEEADDDEKKDDSFGFIQGMRAEAKKHLEAIAKAHGKKRLILLVDDLDRARPEEAIAILDSLYHLLMPHHDDKDWPLTSIWAVNTTVLEEYLYQEYRNLPSFDPNAYLEKLFDRRISVPPLFHNARNMTTEPDSVSEAFQLWRNSLEPWCPTFSRRGNRIDDLAHSLADEVNYAVLGNLRLHASVVLANCLNQAAIHLSYSYPFCGANDEPRYADHADR